MRLEHPPRAPSIHDFLSYCRQSQPVPTDQLMERIRNRDWDGARQRAITHPWDARFRNGSNSTSLHLVCVYRAPSDVVQVVLDAFPANVMATDGEGWTPLHVAFLYGADDQTSLMLIKRGGVYLASMQSRLVGSPLHVACRHGVSTPVLMELLKTHPGMACIANQAGTKPATLLWYNYAKNPANEETVLGLMLKKPIDLSDPGISKLMNRIAILVNAGQDMDIPHKVSIHKLVALQSQLGLGNVIPLAVRLYPEQLSKRDTNGNLPLHIAVSAPVEKQRQQRYGRFQVMDAVSVLLDTYPQAASVADRHGRLALHLALERGKRSWNSGIQKLVDAAPRALETRDVKTGLYPVQLAAMNQGGDNVEALSTIYQLLLAFPPVTQNIH